MKVTVDGKEIEVHSSVPTSNFRWNAGVLEQMFKLEDDPNGKKWGWRPIPQKEDCLWPDEE